MRDLCWNWTLYTFLVGESWACDLAAPLSQIHIAVIYECHRTNSCAMIIMMNGNEYSFLFAFDILVVEEEMWSSCSTVQIG